ncbi:hypothetical protein TNCV_1777111 [Trichonephila clavipes]|nr:hypothetical protein TNCV_1777111 [Trichonephila clavipes]
MWSKCRSSRSYIAFRCPLPIFRVVGHQSTASKLTSLWNCSAAHEFLLRDKKILLLEGRLSSPVQLHLLNKLRLKTPVLQCLALTHAFLCVYELPTPDCGNPTVLERQHCPLLNLFAWLDQQLQSHYQFHQELELCISQRKDEWIRFENRTTL